MARELRAYLWDVAQAAADIQSFIANKTADEYRGNPMIRAAVERKLEIIGEALSQAIRYFPEITNSISHCKQVIALRNRLIHGYATVSDLLIWEIVQNDVPQLRQEAEAMLHRVQ
jgi:uncharacterized protein with HEPN domain